MTDFDLSYLLPAAFIALAIATLIGVKMGWRWHDLSAADPVRMVEEKFDRSGLGDLLEKMPMNAQCVCPLCGQGHDPKLVGDGGEGKDVNT